MSLAVSDDLPEMLQRPAKQLVQQRHHAHGAVGERIFHLHRYGRDYLAGHKPVGLHALERHGKHLLGYIRDGAPEVIEAHGALLLQRVEGQQRPFVHHPGKYVPDGTIRKHRITYVFSVHDMAFKKCLGFFSRPQSYELFDYQTRRHPAESKFPQGYRC